MQHKKQGEMLKRAVTLTAAAIFCSIILFTGILTVFVRIHSTLSGTEITMPYIEKTSQGQARLHAFGTNIDFTTQAEYDEFDKRYIFLFLYPDDSSLVLSLFEAIYDEFSD